jgi:hypothetical protein
MLIIDAGESSDAGFAPKSLAIAKVSNANCFNALAADFSIRSGES